MACGKSVSILPAHLDDGDEITLQFGAGDPAGAEALLRSIVELARDHQLSESSPLRYGFWEIVLRRNAHQLDVWECAADGQTLERGADLSLRWWREQHDVCARWHAEFSPPSMRQLIVVSDGVFEGDVVQGVRYPSPDHMSGWWITTDRYNGDIKTLKTEHAFHLVQHRPDLARFLALLERPAARRAAVDFFTASRGDTLCRGSQWSLHFQHAQARRRPLPHRRRFCSCAVAGAR